jgi:hypothetical protein
MAKLTLPEAAIESGFSVELIERLLVDCPQSGEERTLPCSADSGIPYVEQRALQAYLRYLRAPWPLPAKGSRPHIPSYIRDDIRAEPQHGCTICGSMDNGEIAHIDPVAETRNNSPDNLILLCPNHHSKYDYGYVPASNVTKDVLLAAKEVRRASRRRMLRSEGNVLGLLHTLLQMLEQAEVKVAEAATDPLLRETYSAQAQSLVHELPELPSLRRPRTNRTHRQVVRLLRW